VALRATAHWWQPGDVSLYRFIPTYAEYSPASPWHGSGRFDNGSRLTLYLASTREAAIAEFLRRHPELLDFQDALRIRLFRVDVLVSGSCLDVRTREKAASAEVEFDRLRSNDADEETRYWECRRLADEVEVVGHGIGYPSAAVNNHDWCLVLFGESGQGWEAASWEEIPRVHVPPDSVNLLLKP
jgi:hypothetical protein